MPATWPPRTKRSPPPPPRALLKLLPAPRAAVPKRPLSPQPPAPSPRAVCSPWPFLAFSLFRVPTQQSSPPPAAPPYPKAHLSTSPRFRASSLFRIEVNRSGAAAARWLCSIQLRAHLPLQEKHSNSPPVPSSSCARSLPRPGRPWRCYTRWSARYSSSLILSAREALRIVASAPSPLRPPPPSPPRAPLQAPPRFRRGPQRHPPR
mmetsp:Transcript_579/g.2222  ORF Transcript_579/g.2222 Transcript_579/m.2222 type:complete len:206 (-) Transcript_579:776-1393(-)